MPGTRRAATFLDTSAADRLLVQDVGSAEVLALVRSPGVPTGSALLVAELLRVATRHRHGHAGAERVVRRMRLVAVEDAPLREAGRLDLPACGCAPGTPSTS